MYNKWEKQKEKFQVEKGAENELLEELRGLGKEYPGRPSGKAVGPVAAGTVHLLFEESYNKTLTAGKLLSVSPRNWDALDPAL